MQLKIGKEKIWKYLRIFSLAPKEKKNWLSKKRSEERFDVKSKRVSPRVIRQASGSEHLKIVAARWVFKPRLVT